jgi:YbbR domain-containing protein
MKRDYSKIASNIGSLLLALALAVAVWMNAVTQEDPDEVRVFSFPVTVSVNGLQEGLVAQGYENVTLQMTLRGPQSVLNQLQADDVYVAADLSGDAIGSYEVPLEVTIDRGPVRVEKVAPASLQIVVDRLVTKTMTVRVELNGNPAPGFQTGTAAAVPETVVISGPEAAVDRVAEVVATVEVDGINTDINQDSPLLAVDSEGVLVPGVMINPVAVAVALPVQQLGGYRDLVVKAVLMGAVKSGYRLTGLTVSPSVVTLYSDDPEVIRNWPGYVETEPLNINGAQADISAQLTLVLPSGVQVVGNPNIQVEVSISAIEDSITITRPVRMQGLKPGLQATLSPSTVDIIISGPVPDLHDLRPNDVDVYLDLANYGPGTYKLSPAVQIANAALSWISITPEQIEVIITSVSAVSPTSSP